MNSSVSDTLLATLLHTEEEVGRLKETLQAQLDAVRDQDPAALGETSEAVSQIARRLESLLARKAREAGLVSTTLQSRSATTDVGIEESPDDVARASALAGEIAAVESRIRLHAEETHRLYEDLAFALHFAAKLDADLMRSVWDARQPGGATVYTPDGATGQAGRNQGMLNQLG